MVSTNSSPDQQQVLEAADRVARAAYIWIRHGNAVRFPSHGPAARQDMIAGILFGLCHELDLDDEHAMLSAYVYALIDGDSSEALAVARSMVSRGRDTQVRTAYEQGLQAARDLISLLEWPESGTAAGALPI